MPGWRGYRAGDRRRWTEIAATSRASFDRAANPAPGLTPDYAEFNSRYRTDDGHGNFRFGVYRTAANWSVDQAWWNRNPNAAALIDRLRAFLLREPAGPATAYRLDGIVIAADPAPALVACTAVASLAAAGPPRHRSVGRLWSMVPPRGRWRCYSGTLQFMAVLHAARRFRAYQRQ